jgi:hypothetical protein
VGQFCVATADGRAYYSIASKLRRMRIPFLSLMPAEVRAEADWVVLTTKREAKGFGGDVVVMEELDEDLLVMKGQLLARASRKRDAELLMGIDPGSRLGLAVFYGGAELASRTFTSKNLLCSAVRDMVNRIPNSRSVVKIGNGEPRISAWLATKIKEELPRAIVEVVDESGTSARTSKYRGLPSDQSAAVRIAFRRGRPEPAS